MNQLRPRFRLELDSNPHLIDFFDRIRHRIKIAATKFITSHSGLIEKFEIDRKRSKIDRIWSNSIKKDRISEKTNSIHFFN